MDFPVAATEIFKQFETALDSPVTDLQIEELAIKIVRWEDFASFFQLSNAEQEEIRRNNPRNYRLQKKAALYTWKSKLGREATCRAFLNEAQRLDKKIGSEAEGTGVLVFFHRYLVQRYVRALHPSKSRGPFSHSTAYVDLPLFEASSAEDHDRSQQNAEKRKTVHLSQIFSQNTNREVVLLEGVAGSGKTTLAWHAFQEWAKGRLFEKFALLIYVSLEDPDIQSATCLADIIPHPSRKMRESVADAIAAEHEKEVCFLLDGWDELPPNAQHSRSFLHRLIAGKPGRMMLSHCSIIVTSRPGASGSLRPLLTSRIVVGRLDRLRIDTLFSKYLTIEESEELSKLFRQRPHLANLCNLPLNAMIVIHLFRGGVRKFPETRTELFKALLCYVLRQHIELRTHYDVRDVSEQFDFKKLPKAVLEKFMSLCVLGFRGIMQHSKVFTMAELKCLGLGFPFDTFSLVEAHLNMSGYICGFAFLHYSVQEFLAAWHMSRLSGKEQAEAVSDILSRNPLSPVLPFYAGLTGLSNPAAREVLLEVTKYPLDFNKVLSNAPQTESADRRRLALALLNCIYESQDPACFQKIHPSCCYPSVLHVSFQFLRLDPSDCLSIGHAMAYIESSCLINLGGCAIGDAGVEAMLTQLQRSGERSGASEKPVCCLQRCLDLGNCRFSSHCMRAISPILQSTHITAINFFYCWPPKHAPAYLKYLIEGLSRRSKFFDVDITGTFTKAHIYYVVLLLAACPLRLFQAIGTDIGGCMCLMAEAIKQNTTLAELRLSVCKLWEKDLVDLGHAVRNTLEVLAVDGNLFGPSAMVKFLRSQFFSRLESVDFGRELNEEEKRVKNQLLKCRRETGLPSLVVKHPVQDTGVEDLFRTLSRLGPGILTRKTDNY